MSLPTPYMPQGLFLLGFDLAPQEATKKDRQCGVQYSVLNAVNADDLCRSSTHGAKIIRKGVTLEGPHPSSRVDDLDALGVHCSLWMGDSLQLAGPGLIAEAACKSKHAQMTPELSEPHSLNPCKALSLNKAAAGINDMNAADLLTQIKYAA